MQGEDYKSREDQSEHLSQHSSNSPQPKMQKLTTKLESQLRQNSMRAKDLDLKKINSTITKDSKEGSADKYLKTVDSKDSRKSLLKRDATVTQSRLAKLGAQEQAEIIRVEKQKIEEQEKKEQEELQLA